MNANTERLYLHYIFNNPQYFKQVESHFFKTAEISLVYNTVREDYYKHESKRLPGDDEIIELVKLADKEDKVTTSVIRSILKNDVEKFRDTEYIKPRFNAWVSLNCTSDGLITSIDEIRDAKDEIDPDKVLLAVDKIRGIMDEATKSTITSDDLGSNFDDPEAHNQELHLTKIETGWKNLDRLIGSGLDFKTLNVLMGETNVGKSVWMHNFAVNAANNGHNVAIVSLEMSERKVMKRLGSIRLALPIAEYDELSKDTGLIADRLDKLRRKYSDGVFEKELGKIYVKEYPTGTMTISDLDSYIKRLQEVIGIKLDMVLVDYISIMCPEKRLQVDNNLYMKGKHMAEGLRSLAQKHNLVMVTATQLSKEKFGASDINLNDMPESKAIAETADTVFAIIRNPAMKINGLYHLKALKLRDSEFAYDRIQFNLNKQTLAITEEKVVENNI